MFMKQWIMEWLFGTPASGDYVDGPVGLKHVYPDGTPLTPRIPFNDWITSIHKQLVRS